MNYYFFRKQKKRNMLLHLHKKTKCTNKIVQGNIYICIIILIIAYNNEAEKEKEKQIHIENSSD